MTATLSQSPSSADVARGREAVQQELAEAQRTHEQAAYHAATNPGSEDAREQLAQARRRIGVLQSELEGLEAVGREASRREKARHIESMIDEAEEERQQAMEAVDAVKPAFDRVAKAIRELGDACGALREAERQANRAEGTHAQMPHGHQIYPSSHDTTRLRDALLWLVFRSDQPTLERSEVVVTTGGEAVPERANEAVAKQSDRARTQINLGIDRRIAELRERLQAFV